MRRRATTSAISPHPASTSEPGSGASLPPAPMPVLPGPKLSEKVMGGPSTQPGLVSISVRTKTGEVRDMNADGEGP